MANLSKKKNYRNETLLFLENGAETLIEKHFRAVFLAVLSQFWIQKCLEQSSMLLHVLKREKSKTIAVKTKGRCITQALQKKRFR